MDNQSKQNEMPLALIVEDKDFLLALINGNIEKEDHKQKHERMLELMMKIEKL